MEIENKSYGGNSKFYQVAIAGFLALISLFGVTVFYGNQTNNKNVLRSSNKILSQKSSDSDFKLWSLAFDEGEHIDDMYTCNGDEFSPPMEWSGAPDGTVEFMIQMTTPTIDGITYDWTLYNIDVSVSSLDTNVDPGSDNNYIVGGTFPYNLYYCYNSPCSTGPGPRNYTFTLYALSGSLMNYDEFANNATYGIGPHVLQFAYDRELVLDTASTYGYAVSYNNPDDNLPTKVHVRRDTICRIEL